MIQTQIKLGKYKDIYNNKYNRLQFLTINEIINDNKKFHIPMNIKRKD